ncbi:MAG TPA: DUF4878 domain-containing protein [Gemmatimonadales bacterium]|nr:DUF4878 domain-containing protein [Gemmatimonadales bacterium]
MSRVHELLFAVTLALASCSWGHRPGDTAVDFVNALNRGDTEAAMDLSDLQLGGDSKALEEMAFRVIATGIDLTGGVESVEVVEETVNDDRADVRLEIAFKDRDPNKIRLTLVKVDGDWKVRGVR